jgi:hypothetical protein
MNKPRREPITKPVTRRATANEAEAFLKGMAARPTQDLGTVYDLDHIATKLWDGLEPIDEKSESR